MKKLFLCTALVTSLLMQFPARGDDTTKGRETSVHLDAVFSAAWELKDAFRTGMGSPVPQLDKLAAGQFSPPTRT